MGTLSNILGSAGAPLPLVMNGVAYKLSPFTKNRQSAIEQMLIESALRGADGMKRQLRLDAETYAGLLHRINRDINNRAYSFGGEEYQKSLNSFDGMVRMLWVMIKDNHPEFEGDEGLDQLESLVSNNVESVQAYFERINEEIEAETQKKTKEARQLPKQG